MKNLLFIEGKTLYPKKQFHSSPSWLCLHLSGTTLPQYLIEDATKQHKQQCFSYKTINCVMTF